MVVEKDATRQLRRAVDRSRSSGDRQLPLGRLADAVPRTAGTLERDPKHVGDADAFPMATAD
jgi:hypothetical protein